MFSISVYNLIKYLIKNHLKFKIIGLNKLVRKYIINSIIVDTRLINQDIKLKNNRTNLFIAIKGERFDSHSKIKDLVSCCKIIVIENILFLDNENDLEEFCLYNNLIAILCEDTRLLMSYIYKFYYELVDEKLNIFAITGTDGKTSMVNILSPIFSSLFGLSASIGTLGVYLNGCKLNLNQTTPTTPEIYDLYNILNQLNKKKTKYVFMEATSIASTQKRLSSISFNSLSFTNMTSDHLDFHKNLEDYYEAKLGFINQLARSNKKNKTVIYNSDCTNKNLIEDRLKIFENINSISYGLNEDSDFQITNLYYKEKLLNIKIKISQKLLKKYRGFNINKSIDIKTSLNGRVNAYNIANTIAHLFNYCVIIKKKPISNFFAIIEKSKNLFLNLSIPGRMEKIEFKKHHIFIDYAHTAASLENAIKTLIETGYDKIITIMGCGGDRDKTKRPLMGKVATELSDYVLITSDNPRNEEPIDIVQDIEKGIFKKNYTIEIDRRKAIIKGIDILEKEKGICALLIAGKGHEDYQEIKGVKYHFSDKEIVDEIIQEKNVILRKTKTINE